MIIHAVSGLFQLEGLSNDDARAITEALKQDSIHDLKYLKGISEIWSLNIYGVIVLSYLIN